MHKTVFTVLLTMFGFLFSFSVRATETPLEEAVRRVPPVLHSFNIPDKLISGQSYTINWSLVGYENNYKTIIAFFNCTGIPSPSCGNSYSDPKIAVSGKLPSTSTHVGEWSYLGAASTKFDYSFTFTPIVTTNTDTVIRFYYIGGTDDSKGRPTISTMAPGNLAHVLPYDTSGRRLSTIIFASDALTAGAPNGVSTMSETITQNTTLSKKITVTDLETPNSNLRLSVTSSNQTLVPDDNIYVAGIGGSRNLKIVPADGQTGNVTITIAVRDDDGNVTSSNFNLSVTP